MEMIIIILFRALHNLLEWCVSKTLILGFVRANDLQMDRRPVNDFLCHHEPVHNGRWKPHTDKIKANMSFF